MTKPGEVFHSAARGVGWLGLPRSNRGLIQVYTGNGKGKTTAAMGLALRAAGQDLRVTVVQFMKGGNSGEVRALGLLDGKVAVRAFGRPGFVHRRGGRPEDREAALEGLRYAREVMRGRGADLLVLDELNNALHFGLLEVREVLEFLEEKPPEMEVVITGRNAPAELLERADLVTEMREVKHPYQGGMRARRGIEY